MAAGDLVIVGGAEIAARRSILQRFLELARKNGGTGGTPRIIVLGSASADPLAGLKKMRTWFGELGVPESSLELLEASTRKEGWERGAWDRDLASRAREADAIWILGGNQNAVISCLISPEGEESPLLTAIRDASSRGAVIGGSSAGAAVMSNPMIGAGTSFGALAMPREEKEGSLEIQPGLFVTKGLGLFPEGMVDQHFDKRARLARLLDASMVEDGGRRLAFGVSEATAMIYEADKRGIGVVGLGSVYVLDPRSAKRYSVGGRIAIEGAILHLLRAGDRMDLARGTFSFPGSERIGSSDAALDVANPIASGVLSAYGSLAEFAGRLLLDNRNEGLFLDPRNGRRYAKSYLIDEGGRGLLGWEVRFYRREADSALWFKEGEYSFESVELSILPVEVEIRLLE